MKTLALVLSVFVLLAGAAPMALAQQDSSQQQPGQQSAPSASPSAPGAASAPDTKTETKVESKSQDTRTGVDLKAGRDRGDDAAGAASPRTTESTRTGFFGLSPTAAIIVSVAVLLVVVLAIVAMTQGGGSSTYIDKGDRRL